MLRLMRLVLAQAPALLVVPGTGDNSALYGILARLLRLMASPSFETSQIALTETVRALVCATRQLSAAAHAAMSTSLAAMLSGKTTVLAPECALLGAANI